MLYLWPLLHRYMSEDEGPIEDVDKWLVAMKRNQVELDQLASPLALANKFAESLSHAKNADLNVVVPQIAEDWATEVIQEFAFLVGEIARVAGMSSKIIDRTMFDPEQLGSIEWNEGIMLQQVLPFENAHLDPEFYDENDHYHDFGNEPCLLGRFRPQLLENKFLSGQYNRLFPLKIVMRVAANLLLNSEGYKLLNEEDEGYAHTPLFLEDLRVEAAKVATYAKKRMEWLDSSNGTEYGSWFSVALTDGSKKQDERFMSQFVGSVRTPGQGLPFELGFLDYDEDEVKITELGLRFTLAENQVIDNSENWQSSSTLSPFERKILLQAIQRNVPSEYELMKELITMIKNGVNTPKAIEEFLKENYGKSDTEASLQRTGIFARMQEMGMVQRVKEGRTVHYEILE
jgi:hypothetical protein